MRTHIHAHSHNARALDSMPCCVQMVNTMKQKDSLPCVQPALLYADVDLSMLDVSKSARSSHVIAPDPAAFKEAVKNGGKLWPIVSHYLAALGQASLIRQRLASDLTTSER